MKTLAKTHIALGLIGFAVCIQGSALAYSPKRVRASVDCGSLQLDAVTDQVKVFDEFTRATLQVIHLVNRSRHIDTHLDLKQHISQDSKLGASASQPKRVKASVDCGSFQLNSVTDEIKVPDQITRATFQVIRLVNRSRHIDTHLDLKQYFSPDTDLGSLLDIDGVATEWRCIRAPSGADFVFVGFVCAKERGEELLRIDGISVCRLQADFRFAGKRPVQEAAGISQVREDIDEEARHLRRVLCAYRLPLLQGHL